MRILDLAVAAVLAPLVAVAFVVGMVVWAVNIAAVVVAMIRGVEPEQLP